MRDGSDVMAKWLLAGIGAAGAGLLGMYLFDRENGVHRRASVQRGTHHVWHAAKRAARHRVREMMNGG